MATTYDPFGLLTQEAEDFAYAQQTYMAHATSAMTGPLATGLPSWLGQGTSNTQLAQAQALNQQSALYQAQQNQALQAQNAQLVYAANATTTSVPSYQPGAVYVATGNHHLVPINTTNIYPSQLLQVGTAQNNLMPLQMPPARPHAKSVFYSLIEYIEETCGLMRSYDDMIMAMLDRRRFKEDRVSLTAFAAFLVVNGQGANIKRHVAHLEANGVTFSEDT